MHRQKSWSAVKSIGLATSVVWRVAAVIMMLTIWPSYTSRAETWGVKKSEARFEIHLLKCLIEHHQLASALAQLGLDRAVHPELRTLCAYESWALRSEMTELRRLLGEWYDMDYEPRTTAQDVKTIERIAALDGEEFEFAFLMELKKLDAAALRAGRHTDRRAGHTQLPTLWANIEHGLASEVAQTTEWLCQWHNRCRAR